MVVLLLRLHKKAGNKKKKGYSPCAITQAFGACARVHLSAFVYELFVCAPQALGCWVCSLKRLCFCCHPSLSLSLSRSVSLAHTWTPLPVLSAVCIVHHHRSVHLYSIINALS